MLITNDLLVILFFTLLKNISVDVNLCCDFIDVLFKNRDFMDMTVTSMALIQMTTIIPNKDMKRETVGVTSRVHFRIWMGQDTWRLSIIRQAKMDSIDQMTLPITRNKNLDTTNTIIILIITGIIMDIMENILNKFSVLITIPNLLKSKQ